MCRIAGAVGIDLGPGRVRAALDAQRHGGPDDEGVWIDSDHPVALCHNRLSIIDTTRAGRQPMASPDGSVVLVFNGEIYNYRELRDALPPRAYRSATDSEVLLTAYMEWGTRCLQRLNGMFAFAVWDRRRKRLFCARDRLGIKPFHYAVHRGAFYFSSEIKGLAALGVPTAPDMKSWADYLVHGYSDHGTRTFFEGVQSLAPGTALQVELGRPCDPRPARYWNLPREAEKPAELSDAEAQRTLLDLLDDSVRLRLRADVPVGVNLSGGLDSASLMASVGKVASAVGKVASPMSVASAQTVDSEHPVAPAQMTASGNGGQVHVFTATFGDPSYDELPFAGQVPGRIGWMRNRTRLDVGQVMPLAEEAVWHQEAPFGGVATLAYHHLHQQAREHDVTVLLEGQGVDELLAGYRYYVPHHLLDLLAAGRRRRLRAEVAAAGGSRRGLLRQMRSIRDGRSETLSQDGTSHLRPRCASPSIRELAGAPPEFERPFTDRLRNVLYRDLVHTKLPRVLRMNDRLSMASSRELREPFLDHRIVEFAFRLPGHFKIRDGFSKDLLRQATRDRLPKAVRQAPKRAVVTPQREWLAGPLADAVGDVVGSPEFAARGLFEPKEVAAELRAFREQGSPNSFHVWQWVVTELWFRRFAP